MRSYLKTWKGTAESSGQAMIEFVIGLVAVMVLLAGLLQIASLTKAETDTMIDARREAAEKAMSDPSLLGTADFVGDVLVGGDESKYSADDIHTTVSSDEFVAYIVEPSGSSAAEWAIIDSVPSNSFSAIRSSSVPTYELGMVKGDANDSVPLISAVQKLIYDDDSIEVESEVWMPWLRGIY
ncbi:MAG: pilus assembly protein [Kiritimatiellia bacterium]|jgi:hypothetical protein|nr:pilus assembly protein [Kiritimatiellia bacterium]